MERTAALAVLVAVVLIGLVFFVTCGPARPIDSSPSPSPSLTPTTTPTPAVVPASTAVVHWATRWRRAAVRSYRAWSRARLCLGMKHVAFHATKPRRSADKARWLKAGKAWRAMWSGYRHRTRLLVRHMTSPGGGGAYRWMPAIRWYWRGADESLVRVMAHVIWHESSGQRFVWNHGGSGAFGLFQLLPKPAGVWSVASQMVYAWRHKYLQGGLGHWAGCKAFAHAAGAPGCGIY